MECRFLGLKGRPSEWSAKDTFFAKCEVVFAQGRVLFLDQGQMLFLLFERMSDVYKFVDPH